jgi:hypothetical protein
MWDSQGGISEARPSIFGFSQLEAAVEVGVRASLRNGRPLKSVNLRRLEAENRNLKEVVLNQALLISELKKEMSLD